MENRDYSKNYYAENKIKWREYYNNTEKYREYQKNYHKDYQRSLRDKLFGFYLYFLLKDNKVVYIGSTTDMYHRFYNHNSSGKEFDTVLYKDLTDVCKDREELYKIEYYYINLYKDELIFNVDKPRIDNNDVEDLINRSYFKEMKKFSLGN